MLVQHASNQRRLHLTKILHNQRTLRSEENLVQLEQIHRSTSWCELHMISNTVWICVNTDFYIFDWCAIKVLSIWETSWVPQSCMHVFSSSPSISRTWKPGAIPKIFSLQVGIAWQLVVQLNIGHECYECCYEILRCVEKFICCMIFINMHALQLCTCA